MTLKIKYVITEIQFAGVLVLKIYSKSEKTHIKVSMMFYDPKVRRLTKFDHIPTDCEDYNTVIESVTNNTIRGKVLIEKIKNIPTETETKHILFYIKKFCKDEFILNFIH
jgi:hypothetical protein